MLLLLLHFSYQLGPRILHTPPVFCSRQPHPPSSFTFPLPNPDEILDTRGLGRSPEKAIVHPEWLAPSETLTRYQPKHPCRNSPILANASLFLPCWPDQEWAKSPHGLQTPTSTQLELQKTMRLTHLNVSQLAISPIPRQSNLQLHYGPTAGVGNPAACGEITW